MQNIVKFQTKFPLILLSIVLVTVTVSIITMLLISSRSSQQPITNAKQGEQISKETAVAYASVNAPENKVSYEVFLYNLEKQTSRKIFELAQTAMSTPRFLKYQDKILITSDTGVKLINRDGEIEKNSINPIAGLFTFTPTNSRLAYIRKVGENNTQSSDFELVIRDNNGTEKTLNAGSGYTEPGMLRPRAWAPNENYIYADRVIETDGFELGLEKINTKTLQVEDIQKVSELGLVNYIFDQQDHVFSLRAEDIDPYTRKTSERIIRLTLSTEAETSFTLEKTRTGRLFATDSQGRYIAYEHYGKGEQSELWVYDTAQETEIFVTKERVADNVFWNKDTILFATVFTNPTNQIQYTLQLFNVKTQEQYIITSLQATPAEGKRIEAIGWL